MKSPPTNRFFGLVKRVWLFFGSLDLAVILCLFLALTTAIAYPLIQKNLTTFIPLGEVGLWTWLTSYGRLNLGHTFWFYGLMVGLTFLAINSFVCSTIRVWAILGPRGRKKGWLLKLGPHLTHYAVVVMVLGYLGSYTLAQALPGRALVPDGPALKLPGDLGTMSARVVNPIVYQGQRLEFFQDWYLDPGLILTFQNPAGQTYQTSVAYNRPAHYGGYNFYLADFYPKSAQPAGLGGYKTIKLTIRRDPAALIYLSGIIIFAVGVGLCLADLIQNWLKRGQKSVKHLGLLNLIVILSLAPVWLSCSGGDQPSAAATRLELNDQNVDPTNVAYDGSAGFLTVGEYSILKKDGYSEIHDGAGRTLALVPRGDPAPAGFEPTMIINYPVQRVAAYSAFDVAMLNVLGQAETLVALTTPASGWHVDYVKQGFASGRIAYIGEPGGIDYERLKAQKPDVVMTWDPSIVPMLDSLGIPVLVTSTPVATCLATQIRFVEFLAPFFGQEARAKAFYQKVRRALADIRAKTGSLPKPKAMWGDIYEKRVLVEPGNAWVAELIGLAQSDYLFDDVYGTSCIEISMERFLYSGSDADLYFTYRSVGQGVYSKEALLRINPLLEGLKPLTTGGRALAPRPIYAQSADRLDELLTEIAAILHPEAYPGYELKYFVELPLKDAPHQRGES
ncbi:MAG: ABC transporter substrate-binding protein [Deltaproteobacteria bacterium]|nr:ABC transporter substrate-binding protein [Deltaproteobacteria bacterium]